VARCVRPDVIRLDGCFGDLAGIRADENKSCSMRERRGAWYPRTAWGIARDAVYSVPDDEMAVGSTLGGPTVCTLIKGIGAIEKVYSIESGATVFGTLVLHHWDEQTGMHLAPAETGTFTLHPEHQERDFVRATNVAVHEDIFVLSGHPHEDGEVDPPAVYYQVELRNDGAEPAHIATWLYCRTVDR
jgi:hypothetical protein